MHLGLVGHQLGEDAAEAQRVVAQRRAQPVLAGGGRVALVEDQVDDLEHRRQPRLQLGAARHFEGHVRLRQRALGAHDALRDRRLGRQEGARDLAGGEAAEQAQRQRHPRLGGEHRMAGDEEQAQQVVSHRVVESGVEVGRRLALDEVAAELVVLAVEHGAAAQHVDGAVLGRLHQPGAGVVGDARLRPALEGGDERVLRQLLGEADVAHHAHQAGDDARRLDAPHTVDGAVDVARREAGVAGAQRRRSHHPAPPGRKSP